MFKSFIKFLIDPFNVFWLLILITMGAWFLKKKRLGKWLAISAGVWFLIISTPLIPTFVINSLEDRYEPVYTEELSDSKAEYHIIVLGGGHGFDDRLPFNSLLSRNALGRLTEGLRLHRQLENSKLVVSGFSSSGRTTQAEMLQQAAILLGVEEKNIIVQKEPGNTYQEAEVYADKHGNSHPVILVTSAAHMPRAMMAFKLKGLTPIASPTNYRLKGSWKRKWVGFPNLANIENLSMGIKEYVGMLWYRISR